MSIYNEIYKNSKVRKPYNKIFDWAKSLPENVIVKKKMRLKVFSKKLVLHFQYIITMIPRKD